MTGYFRQLADRVLDPLPGLRPHGIASGTQMQEPGFEDVLAPIRHAADPPAIAVRHTDDRPPERASHDAPAKRSASATDPVVTQPDGRLHGSEDAHRTTALQPDPR